MLVSFTFSMIRWTLSLKGCGASKRLLEGGREVFWRLSGSLLEPCGGSLGLLGGTLGALSPKKPPRIPKEGPKSSPRRPQEASRGPEGRQKSPKRPPRRPKRPSKESQKHIQLDYREKLKNDDILTFDGNQ